MDNIPAAIRNFIENKVDDLKTITLPYFYADLSNFNKIQEGYRYSHPPGYELTELTGNDDGDWLPNWYVIAQNGMDDPFFIDITEEAEGFPVYYCEHGAGRWDAYKVAGSIQKFTDILKNFKKVEDYKESVLAFLIENTDLDNPLWAEVYAYLNEKDE